MAGMSPGDLAIVQGREMGCVYIYPSMRATEVRLQGCIL
jgi:hypothetical protein